MANSVVKMTPTGKNFSIWGIPANINYFISEELAADSVEGVVNKTTTVKAHSRRRYVNDPAPINVGSHGREFMYDPGRKVGNALPGFSFILNDGTEKRQFTLQGDVMDLHAWLLTTLNNPTKLYTQGASYELTPAEGG